MLIYIARRLAWTVLVILVVLFVTFLGLLQAAERRPGAALRGQVAHTGVAGADPQAAPPRQAVLQGVRLLRLALRPGDENGWPGARLLLQRLRPGQGSDRSGRRERSG